MDMGDGLLARSVSPETWAGVLDILLAKFNSQSGVFGLS